jgi:lipopolysaccharide heptosyltransferase I
MAESEKSPRILLVRLSAIGDCLHAVPVLVALRKALPNAWIGWALEKGPHSLLRGHPMVDRFHVYPRHAFKRREGSLLDRVRLLRAFRKELRETRYEAAVDLQGLTKSGLVAWWSGAPRRVGFRGEDSRELNCLLTNLRVRVPERAVHVVDRNLSLLGALGIEPPVRAEWVMPPYASEQKEMDAFLGSCGIREGSAFAVVNPGATWKTKLWPDERFGEVTRGLARERGRTVVVTWAGDEERAAAERIVAMGREPGPGKTGDRAFVAPSTDLRQLAAIVSRAELFVGNDTGPLHLAVAMGVPCVAVFGASDPARNGPYGDGHRVQACGPECQPCWKTKCAREDLACLTGITAEGVLAACDGLLERTRGGEAC